MRISAAIHDELWKHAREEAPKEACGLVVLREGRAVRYERGQNAEPSPYRFRLDIDPEVWFLEDEGYQLGVFHSHVSSPPRPSRADIEQAGLWQDRPYLILRADTGELAAWRIRDGKADQEALAST